jgi:hypothetical protein
MMRSSLSARANNNNLSANGSMQPTQRSSEASTASLPVLRENKARDCREHVTPRMNDDRGDRLEYGKNGHVGKENEL